MHRGIACVAAPGILPLEKIPGREMAFGIAGMFWTPNGGLRVLSPGEFRAFGEPGCAKAVWNLLVQERGPRESLLSTETRVLCFGEKAQRRFLRYWEGD